MDKPISATTGFCIYVTTICDGPIPVEHDERGYPVVYPTEEEAQRVIAESMIERISQFLDRMREFDGAITVEEYIVPVDVLPDGSILDETGGHFGKKDF